VTVAAPQPLERLTRLGAIGGADGGDELGGVAVLRAVEGRRVGVEALGVASESGAGGQRGEVHVLGEQTGQAGPQGGGSRLGGDRGEGCLAVVGAGSRDPVVAVVAARRADEGESQ
jgi:hypothetical protein